MRSIVNKAPLMRAVAVLSAVAVLVTGVTFAVLQSQNATLSGNSIESATADLRIGKSTTFSASATGFAFKNVVPGGPAMPAAGETFYLKNDGTSDMSLKLALGGTMVNAQSIDPAKVKFIIGRAGSATPQTFSLKQLSEGAAAFDAPLPAEATGSTAHIVKYSLQVAMDEDAVTGTGIDAEISGLNLVFSGSVIN